MAKTKMCKGCMTAEKESDSMTICPYGDNTVCIMKIDAIFSVTNGRNIKVI